MRGWVLATILVEMGLPLWGLVDCSTQFVQMINTVAPSQISKDRRFLVDSTGYVAVVTDPTARIADYLWRTAEGGYAIRSPEGASAIAVDPPLGALMIADARDGACYLPLGVRSPLFTALPLEGGIPFTFRYYNQSPRISADGRLVIDAEGDLLWRPTEACEAGQIYARFDGTSVPASFEYSVKGGRIPLPSLPFESPTAQALQRATLAQGGLLMQRFSQLTANAFGPGLDGPFSAEPVMGPPPPTSPAPLIE